ncbi:hypothetical protein Sjap_022216 [Stephania japonica]|uniref:Uncharacterized protein n=1 Tax=Stephania japonica TaxID=461633 RepID=A0AAP0HSL7_9MAGN
MEEQCACQGPDLKQAISYKMYQRNFTLAIFTFGFITINQEYKIENPEHFCDSLIDFLFRLVTRNQFTANSVIQNSSSLDEICCNSSQLQNRTDVGTGNQDTFEMALNFLKVSQLSPARVISFNQFSFDRSSL